jgi:hypothetical protein
MSMSNPFAGLGGHQEPYVADKEVAKVAASALTIADAARAFAITDDVTNAKALDMLAGAAGAVKQAEALRHKFVDPLNDQVKVINGYFKMMQAPAQEADEILRKKTSEYRAKTIAAARAEEARLAALAARRQVKAVEVAAALGVDPPAPVLPVPTIAAPAKTIVTGGSQTTFRKVHHFEITNRDLVPDGYWIIDEKSLGAAVRAGVNPIPGVHIWDTEEPVVR